MMKGWGMFDWALSVSRRAFLWAGGRSAAARSVTARTPPECRDPAELLRRLAAAYAGCRTYRDSGCVTTRYIRDGGERVEERPFETAFVRPDAFRYEFRARRRSGDGWHRYLVWTRGGEVRTWWDVRPGGECPKSLSLAVAGATGVSGGSAHTVPALLMADRVGGFRLPDLARLADLEPLGDAPVGGADCSRVRARRRPTPPRPDAGLTEDRLRRLGETLDRLAKSGLDGRRIEAFRESAVRDLCPPEEGPVVLWVEKRTLLLRRVEESTRFGTFRTEQVTDYEPRLDGPVPDELLRYDPPA
jgi:hypothetical protein